MRVMPHSFVIERKKNKPGEILQAEPLAFD
jgi:hypothetical protein